MRIGTCREIAHQGGLHPLIAQGLQELAIALEVGQTRRLGQAAQGAGADLVDDGLQGFHRVLDKLGQVPDAQTRLGPVAAQDGDMFGFNALQARKIF